jgi:hypothetical protein
MFKTLKNKDVLMNSFRKSPLISVNLYYPKFAQSLAAIFLLTTIPPLNNKTKKEFDRNNYLINCFWFELRSTAQYYQTITIIK